MKKISNLNHIDTETPEGRLLFAALIILTTSKSITVNGKERNGRKNSPDQIISILNDVADKTEKGNVRIPVPAEEITGRES